MGGRGVSALYLNFNEGLQTEGGKSSERLMSGTRNEKVIIFQTIL